jgi:hypothetical protein
MFIIAPDALALGVQLRVLGLALLDLLHRDRHPQAAEPERDLDVRASSAVVLDLEALDPGIVCAIRAGR